MFKLQEAPLHSLARALIARKIVYLQFHRGYIQHLIV